jgi:hypothetical protein
VGEQSDTLDLAVARLAARQHGVVAVAQLHEAGIRKNAVTRRVKRGQLSRPPPAADPAAGFASTVVPPSKRRRSPQTTRRHNIPVTTVPRTIEDLRGSSLLPPRLLRRAIRQAELRGHHLAGVESDRTRSDLESLFLDLVRPHRDRIPPPEVNIKLGRWTVDFLWREQRVVVETDFWTYHRGSVAFEDDHARELDLRGAGYTVLRFTDEQLEKEPGRVVVDVARALDQEDWYPRR